MNRGEGLVKTLYLSTSFDLKGLLQDKNTELLSIILLTVLLFANFVFDLRSSAISFDVIHS